MEQREIRRIASLLRYAAEGVEMSRAFAAQEGGLFRMPIIYGPYDVGAAVTILDIGAGDGRSGRDALRVFPDATIHSFEPREEACAALKQAAESSPRWHAHRLALGQAGGTRDMTIFPRAGESSSFYAITKTWVEGWPAEDFTSARRIAVDVDALDDWIGRLGGLDRIDLIKLDVQGAELDVIRGGSDAMQRAEGVIIEHMFVEGYSESPGFTAVYEQLASLGLSLVTMENMVRNDEGRLLQTDAYYRRFR
jgi:FkbM family methyltransferase